LIVVVDREQGGRERLEKQGYKVHALASVSELVSALLQAGHISRQEAEAVMNYSRKS
jgi:uridine monophosphate synthetase